MSKTEQPLVSILMGSDNDWPEMQCCYETLKEFGIATEVKVCSAHRTPDDAAEFSKNAHKNGLKVIIAAAGMAAHLAGVMAAHTPLPIIGVPLATVGALPVLTPC
jgi:5-(carboxyamino)imidazole ribonucleotide mutase